MSYTIRIYDRRTNKLVLAVKADTRAELAEQLDSLLCRYPRPMYEFNVTAVVTKNYTLLDDDVTTGAATEEKLTAFVESNR